MNKNVERRERAKRHNLAEDQFVKRQKISSDFIWKGAHVVAIVIAESAIQGFNAKER